LTSVALSLCTTAHPFYTRFANIFGTSFSETTMRPNLRWTSAPACCGRWRPGRWLRTPAGLRQAASCWPYRFFTTAGRRARCAAPELRLSAAAQGRAVAGLVADELHALWDASLARRPLTLTFGLEPAEREESEAPAANGEEGLAPAAGNGAAATASAAQGECPPGSPATTASKRSRWLGRR
jgi:hypothetical protein